MAPPSPRQVAARERLEPVLRVTGPVLDLLLAGDRLSRLAGRGDEQPPPAIRRAAPPLSGPR